jgi:hypothetical protein
VATRPTPIWRRSLRLTDTGGQLIVEVWEGNPVLPTPSVTPDADAEAGRGLLLVDALGSRGHYRPRAAPPPGKVVWVSLDRHRTAGTDVYGREPLLRRTPSPIPGLAFAPPPNATDPILLRRVTDRLCDLDSWHTTDTQALTATHR